MLHRPRSETRRQAHFHLGPSGGGRYVYLKVRGKPESAFTSIRAAVTELDPALPVAWFERLWTDRPPSRWYGMMSFIVTHRTQETGVRLALGAARSAAVWLIVRDTLVMIGAGTAIALFCVWALGRLVETQLFGVRPADGLTIAAASLLLAFVPLAATMLPECGAALQ